MKICTSEQEYINAVAIPAQRACKRYGYLPSVLIAQSCLENGYGIESYWDNPQIALLLKANNMVGIKSNLLNDSWDEYTVWQGESITKDTPEEYDGKMVTIEDDFRVYDSIERSFCDFLLFLTYASNYGKGGKPKYGKKVLSMRDPSALIKKVASLGYATGSTYPSSVMRIINKHDLTKYDNLSDVKPSDIIKEEIPDEEIDEIKESINIIDRTAYNTPPRWGNTREALVFHFLGVKAADNPDLYDGGYGGQWYISRKGEIYHSVKEGGTVWAVGSGGWGLKGTRWNNSNTESVEMGCENDNGSDDIYDKKWWFHMVTQEAAVKLARYWLESRGYGVSEKTVNERILIHNTITNKPCPACWLHCAGYQSPNEKGHINWSFEEFKKKIWQGYKGDTVYEPEEKDYLSKGDSGDAVQTMQMMLIACGYSCGSYGADGDFGSATENALKEFQKAHKLKVNSHYDETTKSALEKVYKDKTERKTKYSTVWNGLNYSPVYNYTYYKKKYADLRKAFGTNKQKYFDHFCEYGMKEGRQGSAKFNVHKYKNRYKDLRDAFGDDLKLYYKHFIQYGKKEGRKGS